MHNLKKLLKEIFEEEISLPKYSFEMFTKDQNKIQEHFITHGKIRSFFRNKIKFEKDYLQFIIEKNSQLVLTLQNYFEKTKKAKKVFGVNSYSYNSLNDFWKIFVVITNNYISLKHLFLNGFDYQGKVIFRNTIELTEICICLLGDPKFYTFFRKQNKTTDPNLTFQTLKFGTVRKTTQQIIKSIKSEDDDNLPTFIWDKYLEIRQDFYEDASRHVHANFLNIVLGCYVPVMEVKGLDYEDTMLLNLGGITNNLSKSNIRDLIFYDLVSSIILLDQLSKNHNLHPSLISKYKNYAKVAPLLSWQVYFKSKGS